LCRCRHSLALQQQPPAAAAAVYRTRRSLISCCRQLSVRPRTSAVAMTATSSPTDSAGACRPCSVTINVVIRGNRCRRASDSAYSYTFLRSVVCLSVCLSVCVSHLCPLLKPLDGFTYMAFGRHTSGVQRHVSHGVPYPHGKGRFAGRPQPKHGVANCCPLANR